MSTCYQLLMVGRITKRNQHQILLLISMWLFRWGGADMGSQVDINSCTDACTHFNQGVWPEVGWLGHTHHDTQGIHVSM